MFPTIAKPFYDTFKVELTAPHPPARKTGRTLKPLRDVINCDSSMPSRQLSESTNLSTAAFPPGSFQPWLCGV